MPARNRRNSALFSLIRQRWAPGLVCGVLLSCSGEAARAKREKARLSEYILASAPAALNRLDIDFEGKAKLLGYRIQPGGTLKPGAAVKLTLYWRAEQDMENGWSVFTHLLDASGDRIANLDGNGPLRQWVTPGETQMLGPADWDPGRVYVDETEFTLPLETKTSSVQLVAGIFRGEQRLVPVSGPHDRQQRGIVATLAVDLGKPASPPQPKLSSVLPLLRVPKLPEGVALKIDGILDEPAWQTAGATGGFVDSGTGEVNPEAPIAARAKLLWDAEGFYVGCVVRDADIVGTFKPGHSDQKLWTKDTVEIMIDPEGDGDNRDYYEIEVNPQNLVFDSQFDAYNLPHDEKAQTFGHQGWQSHLKSGVRLEGTLNNPADKDQGYSVELFIPWKSLTLAQRRPPLPGDSWRMNVYALTQGAAVAWSPILGQGNFHKASRFGRIVWSEAAQGSEGVAPAAASASAPGVFPLRNDREKVFERLRSAEPLQDRLQRALELRRQAP